MEQSKTTWTEPKLEPLDVDLSSVASGSNYFNDGSAGNGNAGLSRNS